MKKLQVWVISLTFLFVFVNGCASKKPDFNDRFNQLQLSMSPQQVRDLIGNPELREARLQKASPSDATAIAVETWHYNESGRYVRFENNKVTGFGLEVHGDWQIQVPQTGTSGTSPSGVSPGATPVIPGSLKLGESCVTDSQCAGHNCHFHRCSGKDNCSVPEGQLCATNTDCCTHFCDFGVCKKKL